MPKIKDKKSDEPEGLRPYTFHGIVPNDDGKRGGQAVADCPFCGGSSKFYINVERGLADCKVCKVGENGGLNPITFLRALIEAGKEITEAKDYAELATHRNLLYGSTVEKWDIVRSPIDNGWLVPGYGADGKLNQVYRYVAYPGGKYKLLATPTLKHCLHGVNLFDASKPFVYLCEGPWDAMALYEVLRKTTLANDGFFTVTKNVAESLAASSNVLAVPGCGTFSPLWASLFADKTVVILFDNDHVKTHPTTGKEVLPAAYLGIQRTTKILSGAAKPPKEIQYLNWGGDSGAIFDASLPSGTDVRDLLSSDDNDLKGRVINLGTLLDKLYICPDEWKGRASTEEVGSGMECVPCDSYAELIEAWKEPLRWSYGLDCALSVMLASISSVKSLGDQLWVKVIGPASCGKSTLCEAISVASKYVYPKSTLRGFHSGFQTDGDDNSLVAKIRNKTLVTKDGDTLLQSPNLSQILSEARDIYDRVSRTSYRNEASRDYNGLNVTWILCGTSSLRSIDSSELGERFLDVVIMDKIEDDEEDTTLLEVVQRAARNVAIEADGTAESQQDPELTRAMQLTGGYVNYLRENATRLLGEVHNSKESLRMCARLAKFVAYMRARPSKLQDENAEREVSFRLATQLTRLANCLAIVMNKDSLDEEVIQRVTKVALDTARGTTLEILQYLYVRQEGLDTVSLGIYIHSPKENTRKLLRFLGRIGVVETFEAKSKGVRTQTRWRLNEKLRALYTEILGVQAEIPQ